MNPRATRMADMVASVPEFTSRTISMEGTASQIASASSISCSGGRAEAGADFERALQRRQNLGMAVAQQQRAPRADVVDVLVAVDVEDVAALAARDEERIAAHAAKGAHRRIDAAGNDVLRPAKQLFGFGVVHNSLRWLWRWAKPALRGTSLLNPKLMPIS